MAMNSFKIKLLKDVKQEARLDALQVSLALNGFMRENLEFGRNEAILGETPFHCVKYKNGHLATQICKVFEQEEPPEVNLYPLRNYLLVKHKRILERDNSVFSLVAEIDGGSLSGFYLKTRREFLEILEASLKESCLVIQVEIETDHKDSETLLEKNKFVLEKNKVKISELLQSNPEQTEAYTKLELDGEMQHLQLVLKNLHGLGSLKITWNVEVTCANVPFQGPFALENQRNLNEEKDVTIIAGNGTEIKCHCEILTSQSSILEALLSRPHDLGMFTPGGKISLENSEEGIIQFVKCLYGLELHLEELTPKLALELLQLANKFDIEEMKLFLIDFLTSKGKTFYGWEGLIELFFLSRDTGIEDLKVHSLIEWAMSKVTDEEMHSLQVTIPNFERVIIAEATAILI